MPGLVPLCPLPIILSVHQAISVPAYTGAVPYSVMANSSSFYGMSSSSSTSHRSVTQPVLMTAKGSRVRRVLRPRDSCTTYPDRCTSNAIASVLVLSVIPEHSHIDLALVACLSSSSTIIHG